MTQKGPAHKKKQTPVSIQTPPSPSSDATANLDTRYQDKDKDKGTCILFEWSKQWKKNKRWL
jgi:hypothetical protein